MALKRVVLSRTYSVFNKTSWLCWCLSVCECVAEGTLVRPTATGVYVVY
jgi:hypothetical protein